jgi:hypothetical protein
MTEALKENPAETRSIEEESASTIIRDKKKSDYTESPRFGPEKKTALEIYPIRRLGEITIEPAHWLGDMFLEEGTAGALIGEMEAGKTFVAVDFALSVATGTPWHDRAVTQGSVLYIAGEGRKGVLRRVLGWAKFHHVDRSLIPFYVPDYSINLSDGKMMNTVRLALKEIVKKAGKPKLIIVDTWATCLGADENSTADTMAGLSALRSLADPYGSAVLILHHVGHGDKTRGRGSSSLPSNMDMIHIVEKGRDGIIRLVNLKSRDTETSPPMAFKLKPIELEIKNDQGRQETTAVLEDIDYDSAKGPKEVTGRRQLIALGCLRTLIADREKEGIAPVDVKVFVDEWRNACLGKSSLGGSRAFSQTRKTLLDAKKVIEEEGYVCLG